MKANKKSMKRGLAFFLAMLLCVGMSFQAVAQESMTNHTDPAAHEQTLGEIHQDDGGQEEESGSQEGDLPGEEEADVPKVRTFRRQRTEIPRITVPIRTIRRTRHREK